jgi:putative glycosyltransferase (TIGR04348 family)
MSGPAKPLVCLVTPGTRDANNGNWRTAARWAAMLRERYRVIVQTGWDGAPADILVALHGRRSASSIRAFRERSGNPIALVLTGTDLYRDMDTGPEVAASLDMADQVVVLQENALEVLPPRWRAKSRVIFQSARFLAPRRKARGRLDCVAIGHLRDEKDPGTLFRAIEALPKDAPPITVRHIGAALDADLGRAATELGQRDPRYRYLGALPHGLTRSALARAHLLIHPSKMEGGANVIVEALTSGTPVLASRISGNVGMLGADYPGYFPAGDAQALARMLVRAAQDPHWLRELNVAAARRKPLFRRAAEARPLLQLVAEMLQRSAG